MTNEDSDQWWIAAIGDVMVWARLRVLDSGVAEVFDASGETLRFDDENHAFTALLDAEFRAFDGLDEEDAAVMGFDLDSVEPPRANTDEELLPEMTQKLALGRA
ncbi:MAG: hypothetical protein ABJB01_11780 [Rudaea sp.]